jgi:hypothetical protein
MLSTFGGHYAKKFGLTSSKILTDTPPPPRGLGFAKAIFW